MAWGIPILLAACLCHWNVFAHLYFKDMFYKPCLLIALTSALLDVQQQAIVSFVTLSEFICLYFVELSVPCGKPRTIMWQKIDKKLKIDQFFFNPWSIMYLGWFLYVSCLFEFKRWFLKNKISVHIRVIALFWQARNIEILAKIKIYQSKETNGCTYF